MKKVLRSALVLGLLLSASCKHDEVLSPRERAAADQKRILEYMRTHTYDRGALREIGKKVFGEKVKGQSFSSSAVELPSGIWVWTQREGLGDKPTAKSKILLHYQGIALTSDGVFPLPDTRDKAGKTHLSSTLNEGSGQPVWIELSDQAEPWWTAVMPRFKADKKAPEKGYAAQGVAFIPSAQGFGDRRLISDFPGRAVLVYEFEIYSLEKAAK